MLANDDDIEAYLDDDTIDYGGSTHEDMALIRDGWPPEELTEAHLEALERHATARDAEWGWYCDHVPVLIEEIRRLRAGNA